MVREIGAYMLNMKKEIIILLKKSYNQGGIDFCDTFKESIKKLGKNGVITYKLSSIIDLLKQAK